MQRIGDIRPAWWATLAIAFGVLALVPAYLFGVPWGNDFPHHYRLALPFYESIRAGDLYPGWLAASTGGYGDPSYRFYPPAVHYVLAAARALCGNWYDASLFAFTIFSCVGSFGAYFWARHYVSPPAAACAGLFFAFAPYHANELYMAFLMPEFAACGLLPFLFAFTERVCTRGTWRDVAGFAASYALLVLTHLPLTVIGSLALGFYFLVRVERRKFLVTALKAAGGVLVGLMASCFFWLTLLFERPWMSANNVKPDKWFQYEWNFLFGKSLEVEGSSTWWMNLLAVASVGLFASCFAILRRGMSNDEFRRSVRRLALLVLFTFFMCLPLSTLVWAALKPLQETQFPWRWLAPFTAAGSVLAAATIPYWIERVRRGERKLAYLVAAGVLGSLAFTVPHVMGEGRYRDRSTFEAELVALPSTPALDYWLPVWVRPEARPMKDRIEASGREVVIRSWEPEKRVFEIAPGERQEIKVKTFYYPHWNATAEDGETLATHPDENGVLLIDVPPRASVVTLEFVEPRRTAAASVLSVVGWFIILALFAFPAVISKRREALNTPTQ